MPADTPPQLSPDQLRVLVLLAEGHSHQSIARRINASLPAVRMRLSRAYQVLGARNGPHAVAIAYRAGLLPAPNQKRAHQQ